ncbi:DUF4326 domain-containing protein [Naasia sp. SYSU D00948]|uniref:DUF4326 domain-containing protein n=1 Tax=Naasia sp. SYSU D00948 TaxID=2817379 RepID=UPI001B3181BD|nr:DUF4326 domain-containing protein [Naasia sp. SYSU D00948]
MTDLTVFTPARIQYSRTPGWRKPHRTLLVAQGTRWGNPFLLAADGTANRERAVLEFRQALLEGRLDITVEDVRRQLSGQNLGCWCPLDRPCHADVLLEIANGGDVAATPIQSARQGRAPADAPSPY